MWNFLTKDVPTGPGDSVKLGLAGLAFLGGVFALVAAVSPYVSPFALCPVLLLALVLTVRGLGRRVLWERHGRMPPLQIADVRRVRHRLLRNQLRQTYERRTRLNSGRSRGVARFGPHPFS